jgi:hypothetical protein
MGHSATCSDQARLRRHQVDGTPQVSFELRGLIMVCLKLAATREVAVQSISQGCPAKHHPQSGRHKRWAT